MNLNAQVGAAVDYIQTGGTGFARGDTIQAAVIALVPRALWPEKPPAGGTGDLVAEYTGLRFAEGTSVGIGVIMELFINFGSPAVFLGCVAIGALLAVLDRLAALNLRAGDHAGFVQWYVPGLALQQVGGSLMEVAASAAGALVAVLFVNAGLRELARRRR
jgi:hypothetical protein